MKTIWSYDQKDIRWEALSALYKIAPLGDKSPKDLKRCSQLWLSLKMNHTLWMLA